MYTDTVLIDRLEVGNSRVHVKNYITEPMRPPRTSPRFNRKQLVRICVDVAAAMEARRMSPSTSRSGGPRVRERIRTLRNESRTRAQIRTGTGHGVVPLPSGRVVKGARSVSVRRARALGPCDFGEPVSGEPEPVSSEELRMKEMASNLADFVSSIESRISTVHSQIGNELPPRCAVMERMLAIVDEIVTRVVGSNIVAGGLGFDPTLSGVGSASKVDLYATLCSLIRTGEELRVELETSTMIARDEDIPWGSWMNLEILDEGVHKILSEVTDVTLLACYRMRAFAKNSVNRGSSIS